jgi:hypothetical protein
MNNHSGDRNVCNAVFRNDEFCDLTQCVVKCAKISTEINFSVFIFISSKSGVKVFCTTLCGTPKFAYVAKPPRCYLSSISIAEEHRSYYSLGDGTGV